MTILLNSKYVARQLDRDIRRRNLRLDQSFIWNVVAQVVEELQKCQ